MTWWAIYLKGNQVRLMPYDGKSDPTQYGVDDDCHGVGLMPIFEKTTKADCERYITDAVNRFKAFNTCDTRNDGL